MVKGLDPEHNPRYVRRDVTGDGKPETFCNVFAVDACTALGVALPAHTLANDLSTWLASASGAHAGWVKCNEQEAQFSAECGRPVLAVIVEAGHGHIALGVPALGREPGLHIAQAGRTNFSNGPLTRGFDHLQPDFYVNA